MKNRDAESLNSDQCGIDWTKAKKDYPGRVMHEKRIAMHKKHHDNKKYGSTEGNLGNLKAGDISMIVSSPPYEGNTVHGGDGLKRSGFEGAKKSCSDYGKSEGQIGHCTGDTFWAAAKTIVEQCFEILKPGGVAIWVCKDFVRKGQRVPFSDDWLKLCEAVGFKLTCRHRAMLVKEETKDDLFGGTITKKTERKSFFRRLAEAKGSPAIDHEDVICVMKTSVKI